jgi:levansucrase
MTAPMTLTAERSSPWRPEHVAAIAGQPDAALPVIRAEDVVPMLPDHVVWDMWQIAREDGSTVVHDGRSFWFFLSAPRRDDPDLRHDMARIRLFSHGSDGWRDHGDAFPDGFTPGSREWSGSAILGADGETLHHYFTAAGRAGQPRTFEQRLFETTGHFRIVDGQPQLGGWTEPVESVAADGLLYKRADQAEPEHGMILGFRDPGYFRDPADGAEYLLFTGSAGGSDELYDGVVGLARKEEGRWTLLPPIVTALGVNAELERAHIVHRDGLYYLFWSTQRARFDPDGPAGPNGLYGMVAERVSGPWRPLNGTGLVAANPDAEPYQAYCWWVTGELDVISFIDFWGLEGRDAKADPALRSRQFGGTAAPIFALSVSGDRAVRVG